MRRRSLESSVERRFAPQMAEPMPNDANMESIISNLQYKLTGLEQKYNQFVGQCAKIFKENQLRSYNDSGSEDASALQLMQELSSERTKFDKELYSLIGSQNSRVETDIQEMFKRITQKISEAKDIAIQQLPQRGDYRERVSEVFIGLTESIWAIMSNKERQRETNSWIRNIMDLEDNKRQIERGNKDYSEAKKYKNLYIKIFEEKHDLEVKLKEMQEILNRKGAEVSKSEQKLHHIQGKLDTLMDENDKLRETLSDATKKYARLERSSSKNRPNHLSPARDELGGSHRLRKTSPNSFKFFQATDGFNLSLKLELERAHDEIKRIREERDSLRAWKEQKSQSLTQDYENEKATFQKKLNSLQDRLLSFSNVAKNLIENSLQADKAQTDRDPATLRKTSQIRKELRKKIQQIKTENPGKQNIESPMLSPLGSPKSSSRGNSPMVDVSFLIKTNKSLEKERTRLENAVSYERNQADKYCEALELKNQELIEKEKLIDDLNEKEKSLQNELELMEKEKGVIIADLETRELKAKTALKELQEDMNEQIFELTQELDSLKEIHSKCKLIEKLENEQNTFKKTFPFMLKNIEDIINGIHKQIGEKLNEKSSNLENLINEFYPKLKSIKSSQAESKEYITLLEEKVEHLEFMLQQSQELNLGQINEFDEDVQQLETQKLKDQKQYDLILQENRELRDIKEKYIIVEERLKCMQDLQKDVDFMEKGYKSMSKENTQKSLEIEQLRYENNALREEKLELLKEGDQKEKDMMELHSKFQNDIRAANLSIERLVYENSLLKQSKEELDSIKETLENANKLIAEYESKEKNNKSALAEEINDLKRSLKEITGKNNELKAYSEKLNGQLKDCNEKLSGALNENSIYQEIIDELKKGTIQELQENLKSSSKKLQDCKSKKKVYKTRNNDLQKEIASLLSSSESIESILKESQLNESQLNSQIKNLEMTIAGKEKEIENLKVHIIAKEAQIESLTSIESQATDETKKQLAVLLELKQKLENEIKIANLKSNEQLEEIEKLREEIKTKKDENNNLGTITSLKLAEILQLKSVAGSKDEEIAELKHSLNNAESDLIIREKEIEKLHKNIQSQEEHITEIKSLYEDKIKHLENELEIKIQDSKNSLAYLQQTNKQLEEKNTALGKSIQKLTDEKDQLLSSLSSASENIFHLNGKLKTSSEESASLLSLRQNIEELKSQLSDSESSIKALLDTKKALKSRNDELEKLEIEKTILIEKQKLSIQNLQGQIQEAVSQNSNGEGKLREELNLRNDEILEINARIRELEEKVKELSQIRDNLKKELDAKANENLEKDKIIENKQTLLDNVYHSLTESNQLEKDELKKAIDTLKGQVSKLANEKKLIGEELSEKNALIQKLTLKNQELTKECEESIINVNNLSKTAKETQERLLDELKTIEKRAKELESNLKLKDQEIKELSQVIAHEKGLNEIKTKEIDDHEQKENQLIKENNELKLSISQLESTVIDKTETIESFQLEISSLKSFKESLEEKNSKKEKELNEVKLKIKESQENNEIKINILKASLEKANSELQTAEQKNRELHNKLNSDQSPQKSSQRDADEAEDQVREALKHTINKIENEKNEMQTEYEDRIAKLEKECSNLKLQKNFIEIGLEETGKQFQTIKEKYEQLLNENKKRAENVIEEKKERHSDIVKNDNEFKLDSNQPQRASIDSKKEDMNLETEISNIAVDILENPPFTIEVQDDLTIIKQAIEVLIQIKEIVKNEILEGDVVLPEVLVIVLNDYKNRIKDLESQSIEPQKLQQQLMPGISNKDQLPLESIPEDNDSAVFESCSRVLVKSIRIDSIIWKLFRTVDGNFDWEPEEASSLTPEEAIDEDLDKIKAELGDYFKEGSIIKSIRELKVSLEKLKENKNSRSSFSFNEDLEIMPEAEGEHLSFDSLSFRNEFGPGLGLAPVKEETEHETSEDKIKLKEELENCLQELENVKNELAKKILKIQEKKRDIERHEEQILTLKVQLRETDEKLQHANTVDTAYLKRLFQELIKGIPPLSQETEKIVKIFCGILGFTPSEENSISMERKGKRGKSVLSLFR
ncbi:unnamed protein product [Blepharisma stoltei]|uniref:GRIP domain-containing protein n=1 Tax=Blepharisma stoltei TaxID=1481888 RepID=A0AAU9IXA9_9CILI|nr:unnamed protein product [Blepharisma stoltei]